MDYPGSSDRLLFSVLDLHLIYLFYHSGGGGVNDYSQLFS